MHQRALISNTRFIYKSEKQHLVGKLKYFQYRDDRHGYIPQEQGVERWVDCGLGSNYREIFNNCQALASNHLTKNIAARTMVISPQIDLMQAINSDRREAILRELTETTLDNWFSRMGYSTPEYTYVIHHGETREDRPDGRMKDRSGREDFLHAHVILPATAPGMDQERQYYYVGTDKNPQRDQLRMLHAAGNEEMQRIWERELGLERVHELDHQLQKRTEHHQALDFERGLPQVSKLNIPPMTFGLPDHRLEGQELLDRWFGPRDPQADVGLETDLSADPDLERSLDLDS